MARVVGGHGGYIDLVSGWKTKATAKARYRLVGGGFSAFCSRGLTVSVMSVEGLSLGEDG